VEAYHRIIGFLRCPMYRFLWFVGSQVRGFAGSSVRRFVGSRVQRREGS